MENVGSTTIDVRVENLGTIWTFELRTPEAKAWVAENVDAPDYMWQGPDKLAADHRPARTIAQAMQEFGLVLV